MHQKLHKICLNAGKILLKYHKNKDLQVIQKPDGTPVTQADKETSDYIVSELEGSTTVISEESEKYPDKVPDKFYILDPLDGTRYFLKGEDTFVICIGYIEYGEVVSGAIYSPSRDKFYFAEKNNGVYLNHNKLSRLGKNAKFKAFSNGFHRHKKSDWLIKELGLVKVEELGSALKFCEMAEGNYDFYPRFGASYEWDTAAGQIIYEESGGAVVDLKTLQTLKYGKENFLNAGFVAFRKDWEARVLELFSLIKKENTSKE